MFDVSHTVISLDHFGKCDTTGPQKITAPLQTGTSATI